MRTISMVSDSDGEKLRSFETKRQGKIKELLIGATISNVLFDEGIGLSGKDISGLTLAKGDDTFKVSINANQFYDVTETRLLITSQKEDGEEIEKLITMSTPCDDCTKPDCKTRTTPGNWVVDCKEKHPGGGAGHCLQMTELKKGEQSPTCRDCADVLNENKCLRHHKSPYLRKGENS
jgi:hypothetical protein